MDRESTGTLYGALAAARLEFGAIVKDKTAKIASDKGAYSYTFADLASVIEATAPVLARHGLVIIQEPEVTFDESGALVMMHGCIAHAGGEVYPLRPLPMPVGRPGDARAIGSAISYARRYQLSAALNIAPDTDDDAAPGPAQKPAERTQTRATGKQAAPGSPLGPNATPSPATQAADGADMDGDELFMPWYVIARNATQNGVRKLCDTSLDLHHTNGPASAEQYGYLVGLLDSLIRQVTGAADGHKRVLPVLCQSQVGKDNPPSAALANKLLDRLAMHIKDNAGEKQSNPEYSQPVADAMIVIYRAAEAVGTPSLLSA